MGNGPTNAVDPSGLTGDLLEDIMAPGHGGGRPWGAGLGHAMNVGGYTGHELANELVPGSVGRVPGYLADGRAGMASGGGIDGFQAYLDGVGVADPTGIADGLNALIFAARGQYGAALISAIAVLPYVGDLAKLGRRELGVLRQGDEWIACLPAGAVHRADTATDLGRCPAPSVRPASPVSGLPRTGSALKIDPHHAFPDIVDDFVGDAQKFSIPTRGPGGVVVRHSDLYQLEGSLRGKPGIFEWVVDQGAVTHRRFIPRGQVTGFPNQVPGVK